MLPLRLGAGAGRVPDSARSSVVQPTNVYGLALMDVSGKLGTLRSQAQARVVGKDLKLEMKPQVGDIGFVLVTYTNQSVVSDTVDLTFEP